MALFSLFCKKKPKRKNSFSDIESGMEPGPGKSRAAGGGKGSNVILWVVMMGALLLYVLTLYICVLLFSSPDPAHYNKINDPFKYVIDTNVQKHLEDNADVGHHNLESLMLEGLPPKNWGKIKKDAEALVGPAAAAAANSSATAAANSSTAAATASATALPTTKNTAVNTVSPTSVTFVINSASVVSSNSSAPVIKSEVSRTVEEAVEEKALKAVDKKAEEKTEQAAS